ncbi:MAG: cobalamin-binding protein [Dehalococcoidales bacterium]|nr:cobalamin-binding protein [Dehalococcoidales bacterium]
MKTRSGIAIAIVLISAVFLSLLTACTSTEGTVTSPVTLTDQLGRKVTVESTPQKIISLAPSNTEILFALGLGDRVVARTDYCNYPPEAEAKPSVGGFSTPNIEEIVALGPDLILATSMHESEVIPQLESHGLTVIGLMPSTLDETLAAIIIVGQVTGMEKAAEDLVNDMQDRIDAITGKTRDLSPDELTRVLYVVWHEPLMAAGAGTLHDEMIKLSGGTNIAGDLELYATISLEAVIGADPQVIIAGVGMGDGEDLPLQFLKSEERLADTEARLSGAVYPIDMDVVGRAGPRIVEALEQFAAYIHPEMFDQKE